jgi:hypothetical protein
MAKDQHAVPHGEKWAVKGEGNRRATKLTQTKTQAFRVARGIARRQGSDVVIHGRDGKVPKKDSFGRDGRFRDD